MQEDGFLAAAVEDERVAPLEPHDDLALARLVGEQVADGVLIERLGRGGADVDALGVRRRGAARRGGHAVIVEDDVGMGRAVAGRARVISDGSPGPAPTMIDEGALCIS